MINKINFALPKYNYNYPLKNGSPSINTENKSEISNVYYSPVNFKGNLTLEDKLNSIEHLHCPICGVTELSEEKFERIINTKCPTTLDLVNLLEENEEHIPNEAKGLYNRLKISRIKRPDLPAGATLSINYKNLRNQEEYDYTHLKKYIQKYTSEKNFSDKDLQKIENVDTALCNYISGNINYKDCKSIIIGSFDQIENPEKYDLYRSIAKKVKKMGTERFCLGIKDIQNTSDDERVKIFLSKIFVNSKRDILHVKTDSAVLNGHPIATCSSCKKSKNSIIDRNLSESKVAENFIRYFQDIYNSDVVDNELKQHVTHVKKMLYIISKNEIHMNKVTSPEYDKIKKEMFEHESIYSKFTLAGEDGVPCAYCNVTTVPYDKKQEIKEEINNAKNIYELQNIIHKYPQHIREVVKPIFEDFDKILEENPFITENEMIQTLRTSYDDKLAKSFRKLKKYSIMKLSFSTTPHGDAVLYKKYLDSTANKFPDRNKTIFTENYFEIFENTLAKIKNSKDLNVLYEMKDELWQNATMQLFLNPPENYKTEGQSNLRDLLSYTFAKSSSTIGRIEIENDKHNDEQNNLMVLCNDCNKHRKNREFALWSGKSPLAPLNLQKYVETVSRIIKNKNLDEYRNYPQNFAKKVQTQTNGQITLNVLDIA